MFRPAHLIGISILAPLAQGCSFQTEHGRAFLVLGIGVVEVSPEPRSVAFVEGGVGAERVSATGLFLGSVGPMNGLILGHASNQSVLVDPSQEALVEAIGFTDGGFKVNVQPVYVTPADDPAGGDK